MAVFPAGPIFEVTVSVLPLIDATVPETPGRMPIPPRPITPSFIFVAVTFVPLTVPCTMTVSPTPTLLRDEALPFLVTVAFDAEPEAQAAARRVALRLRDWGLAVDVATWDGGKDAGSGARLVAVPEQRLRRVGA